MKRTEAVKGGRASYSGYCVFEDGTEPTLDAAPLPLYLDASVPIFWAHTSQAGANIDKLLHVVGNAIPANPAL